jgi:hypothetical protein
MNKKNLFYMMKLIMIGSILTVPINSFARTYYVYLQNFSAQPVKVQFTSTGLIKPSPISVSLGSPGSDTDTQLITLTANDTSNDYNDIAAAYTIDSFQGQFMIHLKTSENDGRHCISYTAGAHEGGDIISTTPSQNQYNYHISSAFVHFCDGQDTNCIHETAIVIDAGLCP